jgi:hypothetical protein
MAAETNAEHWVDSLGLLAPVAFLREAQVYDPGRQEGAKASVDDIGALACEYVVCIQRFLVVRREQQD